MYIGGRVKNQDFGGVNVEVHMHTFSLTYMYVFWANKYLLKNQDFEGVNFEVHVYILTYMYLCKEILV